MRQDTPRDHRKLLRDYLQRAGLKTSRQRNIIADVFFEAGGHLHIDELLRRSRKVDGKISQATIYRTMKLLVEGGLAHARNFGDGITRYELNHGDGDHHDHLICTRCGEIIEFMDERIEALQEAVARDHGFVVTDHKMELYGLCGNCQSATNGP